MECFYQGQISVGGDRKAKVIESFSKNPARGRWIQMVTNLTMLMTIYPALFQLNTLLELLSTRFAYKELNPGLFSVGLAFALYDLLVFAFVIFFGLLKIVMLMKGDAFKFFRSLPLSKKELQRVIFYTLIRMSWLPIVAMSVVMPILALYIAQGNVLLFIYIDVPLTTERSLLFIVLFILNQLLAIFLAFFVMIVFARFLAHKIYSPNSNPLLGTIFVGSAITVNLAIIPIVFVILSILQMQMFHTGFLDVFMSTELNHMLALVPFFSIGYLSTTLYFSDYPIPDSLLVTAFVGLMIFLLIILLTIRKGYNTLKTVGFSGVEVDYSGEVSTTDVIIKTSVHPTFTFIKQSIKMIPRDFGGLSYFFTGLAVPLLFSFNILGFTLLTGSFTLDIFFIPIVLFSGIVPFFYNKALSSAEENIDGVLSALPYSNRDHFRSRQITMGIVAQIPLVLIVVLSMNMLTTQNMISIAKIAFVNIIAPTGFLILHSFFFGKINSRFTMFKANIDNSLVKYIALFGMLYVMILGNAFFIDGLFVFVNLIINVSQNDYIGLYLVIIVLVNVVNILILELISREIFSSESKFKDESKNKYSFLAPALVLSAGMALMAVIQVVILSIEIITPQLIFGEDPIIANLAILFLSQIIGTVVLVFIIIPLLKVKSTEYAATSSNNLLKTILTLCIGFSIVYVSSQILVSIFSILGLGIENSYSAVLLTTEHLNNPFNIILQFTAVSIGAPLFEELLYRRTMIPLLEKRGASPVAAVFAMSIVFALSHTINDLVNGNITYTITHFWNVFLIGATCGIAYILTRNVLYPILIHGVINLLSFGANFIVIMDNEYLLVNYRLLMGLITIIGLILAVYVIWKYFKSPLASWVSVIKKKSTANILPGLLVFITIFIGMILIITVSPIAIAIYFSDLPVAILINIAFYGMIIVVPLWFETKTAKKSIRRYFLTTS
jgi:membrane protease YdiL (CAAX protease family)